MDILAEKCEMQKLLTYFSAKNISIYAIFNPDPAESGYALPLQTVQIQIRWLLKKPIDLNLHCLSLSM